MPDFTFRDGERTIRFGRGAARDAAGLLGAGGFDAYALLSTERARTAAPWLADKAVDVLDVPPGPVPEAAAAVRAEVGRRPLVALGGGRVIDAAKAIGGADGIRVAAVPTTLSGAPFTPFHRMPAGVEAFSFTRPALVLADPDLMASQPMPQLAASAMNALAHATESLYTPLANPVAEGAALRSAALFSEALPAAREPDRQKLALASFLGGYAVGTTGFAVHHALCQTLVRALGLPHAETNAVLLPHTIRFMTARAPAPLERLISALGGPARADELARAAGVTTLSALGADVEGLNAVIEDVSAHPALGNTPGGAPSADELRTLVESAF